VSPLKIKIPLKNLGRQRCEEGFNSGVGELRPIRTQHADSLIKATLNIINKVLRE
jgi:hypothetical protein